MISSITHNDGRRVIRLSGPLTFDRFREFDDLKARIAEADGACALDLAEVEQADACGLGMLLLANETATEHGIRLEIVMPEAPHWRTAGLARLDRILTLRRAAA